MTWSGPLPKKTMFKASNKGRVLVDGHHAATKSEAGRRVEEVPPPALRRTAQSVVLSAAVRQMLLKMLPTIEGIADDAARHRLLSALARACADHPQSMAALWDMASRSFAATRPLLRLTASAIAEASPDLALGCWRDLAAGEPGHGEATAEYTKALLRRARTAIDENNFAEAVFALHELRRFESSGNYEWLHGGRPLLAQLNFALGNQLLGLDQYKSYRQISPGAGRDERVFSARVGALTEGSDSQARREMARSVAVPKFMPRIDFDRISLKATVGPTIDVLADATVIPSNVGGSHIQVVLTREREILIDQFNLHPRYYIGRESCFLRAVSPDERALIDLTHHPRSRLLRGDHILLGGAPNYYHWLFEYLPRMEVVLREQTQFDTILINSGFQPYQEQSLRILLDGDEPLTVLNTDTTYTCESLHVPTLRPISEAVAYLRAAFLTKQSGSGPSRRLFISRGDAHPSRIRIADEDAVYSALQRYGYEKIILSTLDFRKQVDLFSNAEVIIAAHGAALANIVFAPQNCAVFEINNVTNRHYTFFEEIAALVGQPFHRLVFDGKPYPGFLDEDAACEVDVGVLLERMRNGHDNRR